MKVLCALGARDSAALIERLLDYVPHADLELLLLFVIDEGPRHDLARLRGPLHRGPRLNPERRTQMDEAELRQSDASLAEARAVAERVPGITATTRRMHGNPERTIVDVASVRKEKRWDRHERIEDVMDEASFVHLRTRIWRLLREQQERTEH